MVKPITNCKTYLKVSFKLISHRSKLWCLNAIVVKYVAHSGGMTINGDQHLSSSPLLFPLPSFSLRRLPSTLWKRSNSPYCPNMHPALRHQSRLLPLQDLSMVTSIISCILNEVSLFIPRVFSLLANHVIRLGSDTRPLPLTGS